MFFLAFSILAAVLGIVSKFCGGNHLRVWRNDSLAAAGSSAIVAWAVTALAFGLACKEINVGGWRGWRLRVLEAFVIILAFTQLLYVLMLHAGWFSSRYGPGYRDNDYGMGMGGPTAEKGTTGVTGTRKEHANIYSADAYNEQRFSFPSGVEIIDTKTDIICLNHSAPLTRSFLCFATISTPPSETIFLVSAFRLLRVLHLVGHTFVHFPVEITQLIHLKYLALGFDHPDFPVSVSKLVNLQTLVIETSEMLNMPREVWEMEQLRHLHFRNSSFWPNPSPITSSVGSRSSNLLWNLQTLSLIGFNSCTREVLFSISNLTKLGIAGLWAEVDNGELQERWITQQQLHNRLNGLVYLKLLETLKLYRVLEQHIPPWDVFPPNLKKLSITMCYLSPKSVTTFSKLPNLEILKLKDVNFERYAFELNELVFKTLKFLLIQSSTLKLWEVANSYHFPKLKRLVLKHCFSLKEIPNEIGDIPTLEFMELHHSPAVEQCARRIEDEQRDLGNDSFKVYINRIVIS
nr:putative late blight resistance protein homolog R1B-14 [Ipomoea batatas]